MRIRHATTVLGAAVLSSALAFAQSNEQTKTTAQARADDKTPITLIGCLQSEADYRRQHDAGRGGVAGTGIGRGNEYILTNASRMDSTATTSSAEIDCAAAGTGEAYELTGNRERELKGFLGRRVQITGMLKPADTEPAPAGTSGTGVRPEGGFDPLGQDLRLFEVEVASFGEVAAAAQASAASERQAIGTAGTQAEPAPVASADAELPRTASPLPLAGVLGLLSLAGAMGVRVLRRW